MQSRLASAPLWLALVLSAAACEEDAETAPQPVTPSVERLVTGVCDLVFRCCERGEAAYLLGPYLDQADCASRLLGANSVAALTFDLERFTGPAVPLPNLSALERAVAEGRMDADPAAVEACAAHLGTLECASPAEEEEEDACSAAAEAAKNNPCDPTQIFVGKVERGGTCLGELLSLDCAPGLGCSRLPTSSPLATSPSIDAQGSCVPVGDLGDACFGDAECGFHVRQGELAEGERRRERLYCSQADGTCQLRRKAGETCAYSDRESSSPPPETLLVRCDDGLFCDPVTDVCVAACERGAPCASDESCGEEGDLVCIAGRCDLPRAEGGPCAEEADCEKGLRCAPSKEPESEGLACTKGDPNGEACVAHGACASGFCEPGAGRCAAQAPAGAVCASGENAECASGLCASEPASCAEDADCPSSKKCNASTQQCESYCVAQKPDGAPCDSGSECMSRECVAGFCRTLPLMDGQACSDDAQCDSDFCGLDDTRVCARLPLSLGKRCSLSSQCESEVCFGSGSAEPTCSLGLDEDEACGSSGQPPCNPKKVYCDLELDSPACVPLVPVGEACQSAAECRGECMLAYGRMMCFPPDDPREPICRGVAGEVTP